MLGEVGLVSQVPASTAERVFFDVRISSGDLDIYVILPDKTECLIGWVSKESGRFVLAWLDQEMIADLAGLGFEIDGKNVAYTVPDE